MSARLYLSLLFSALWLAGLMPASADTTPPNDEPGTLQAAGQAAHADRRLNEARGHYRQLLARDPPTWATDEQRALALKFAPRLQLVAGEFFPLQDIVAVIHPDRPVIGYHLFWQDDISFPSDNDPSDHEVVWIEYDPQHLMVKQVWTYYHGTILSTAGASDEANVHNGRPWIGIEWGKHGSIPYGALDEPWGDQLRSQLQRHWQLLQDETQAAVLDPLARIRDWPRRFPGEFTSFIAFDQPLDPRELLRDRRLVIVSRWPNAAINRWCLPYNFAPKTEWPWLAPPSAASRRQ